MAVHVSVRLDVECIKPGEGILDGEIDYLRRVGNAHHRAAEILTRLVENGWLVVYSGWAPTMRHTDVRTPAQARKQLSALAIDPEEVSITTPMSAAKFRRLSRHLERPSKADRAGG